MNHTDTSIDSSTLTRGGHATREFRKAAAARGAPPTILLGIQDPIVQAGVAGVLERLGLRVVAASDGYRIVEYIAGAVLDGPSETRPALIIVDSVLQGCTGLSLLSGLRDLGWDTPVIVLTPQEDEQTRRHAWALGATGVFMTPFDVRELGVFSAVILQLKSDTATSPRRATGERWDQPGAIVHV